MRLTPPLLARAASWTGTVAYMDNQEPADPALKAAARQGREATSALEGPSGDGRPAPLPVGRHGLSRETVERSQRERILEAMIGAVAERGYLETTVADVIGPAGVSRATFYAMFSNKEDCYLATLDWLMARLTSFVGAAWQRHGDWRHQVRAGLGAFLAALAARPEAARVAFVESAAAGPSARERIRAATGSFIPYLDEGRRLSERGDELPDQVSRVVVGGVAGIVFEEVLEGHAQKLLRLLPELLYTVLVPYLGHAAALEDMRGAARRLEEVARVGGAR